MLSQIVDYRTSMILKVDILVDVNMKLFLAKSNYAKEKGPNEKTHYVNLNNVLVNRPKPYNKVDD